MNKKKNREEIDTMSFSFFANNNKIFLYTIQNDDPLFFLHIVRKRKRRLIERKQM
jgi:hypothetical protein